MFLCILSENVLANNSVVNICIHLDIPYQNSSYTLLNSHLPKPHESMFLVGAERTYSQLVESHFCNKRKCKHQYNHINLKFIVIG